MRNLVLAGISVYALCVASQANAVIFECEVKSTSTSWKEFYDTDKEVGWKKDAYSYRKTSRTNLDKPNDKGITYKETDISISRYSGKISILTMDSNGALVHRAEGHCYGFNPENRKF